MALYERLLGYTSAGEPLPPGQVRIAPHAFVGIMAERARGRVTNAQVIASFGLSASEQTELVTLVNRFTQGGSRLTREEFEDVLYIAERRHPPYDTIPAVTTRLGV